MSVEYASLVVGPIETNCYVIWDQATRAAAVIDPGGEAERMVAVIDANALHVVRILLTHGHFDHTFCAGDLAKKYGARIGMHESDVWLLTDGLGVAEPYYDMSGHVDVTPDDLLRDGDTIALGESTITVLHTPGHSAGGLCFVTDAGIFCGDTIFAGSIGRTDFPTGSHDTLIASITSKLLCLDDATPLLPGHGPATTVGEERRTNPYL